MAYEQYRLRSEGSHLEIKTSLRNEIIKLESQLKRLQLEEAPHRFGLMKTYKAMIQSRQELLTQMNG